MGFFQRIGNWLNTTGPKVWNAVKQGASTGYNAVHGIAHKIGSLAEGVDNALNSVKNIPLIGQAAQMLQNHPLYQEAKTLIKTGVDTVDDVGRIGNEVGAVLDKLGGK